MKYPVIGKKAPYMRATAEGEIIESVGIVKAIFLDPRNRLMVGLVDVVSAKNWNVDIIGVNYQDDVMEKYQEIIKRVTEVSEEGNNLVKETVATYNDKVEELYTSILGAPVEFIEPVKPEGSDNGADK